MKFGENETPRFQEKTGRFKINIHLTLQGGDWSNICNGVCCHCYIVFNDWF